MRVAGIIAEYNPFHEGHLHLFHKLREQLGNDTPIVVVMSGDFVQRGEPAIADYSSRTCAALSCGADLVFELPFTFATGSADRFADGAVAMLCTSGIVTDLYFGAECSSLSDLTLLAETDFESVPEFSESLDRFLKEGLSYAASWEKASLSVLSDRLDWEQQERFSSILREPNNILAIAYLRSLKKYGSPITPHLIHREDGYHEETLSTDRFPSATALRKAILSHDSSSHALLLSSLGSLSPFVPSPMLSELLASWNSGTRPLGARELISCALPILRATDVETLSEAAHMGKNLALHLKSRIASMHFQMNTPIEEQFFEQVHTKCFSYTRILRALTSLLIGQKNLDLHNLVMPKYMRLLGFSEHGRTLLKTMRSNCDIPILSRTSDARHYSKDPAFARMNELDILSHDWWTLQARNTWEEDYHFEVIQYKRNRLYRGNS